MRQIEQDVGAKKTSSSLTYGGVLRGRVEPQMDVEQLDSFLRDSWSPALFSAGFPDHVRDRLSRMSQHCEGKEPFEAIIDLVRSSLRVQPRLNALCSHVASTFESDTVVAGVGKPKGFIRMLEKLAYEHEDNKTH